MLRLVSPALDVGLAHGTPTICDSAAPVTRDADIHALPVSESFESYYQRDYRSLLGLAIVLTGDRNIAEDLTQDAMADAHRRWDTIAGYDDPAAWVRRVLVNKRISRVRRLRSESKMLTRVGARRVADVEPTERTMEVWAAVRRLPPRQAQSIALLYWEDLSIAQIAEILDCGTETVKTHLKRARRALAAELADLEGGAR